MSILDAKDSFVMVFTNTVATVSTNSIPVRWLLFDSSDPEASRLKLNAVNIYFTSDFSDDTLDFSEVSVDIIHTKERTALQWQTLITDKVLRKGGIINKQSYDTDPANPTDVYGNVYWDIRDLVWVKVPNDNYCHYNCSFVIIHHTVPTS